MEIKKRCALGSSAIFTVRAQITNLGMRLCRYIYGNRIIDMATGTSAEGAPA